MKENNFPTKCKYKTLSEDGAELHKINNSNNNNNNNNNDNNNNDNNENNNTRGLEISRLTSGRA